MKTSLAVQEEERLSGEKLVGAAVESGDSKLILLRTNSGRSFTSPYLGRKPILDVMRSYCGNFRSLSGVSLDAGGEGKTVVVV